MDFLGNNMYLFTFKKMTLILVLSVLLSNKCLADDSSFEYVYTDWLGASYRFNVEEGTIGFLDVQDPASYCKKTDKFKCISSKFFIFAVPIELPESNTWVYQDIHFKYQGLIRLKALGLQKDVYEIDSKMEDVNWKFFYSPNDGLIAFYAALDSGMGKMYFSLDSVGLFGEKEKSD